MLRQRLAEFFATISCPLPIMELYEGLKEYFNDTRMANYYRDDAN